MATGQTNQQLQDDPLAELRRARQQRDRDSAATSDDPLESLRASRRARDEAQLQERMLVTIDPEVAATEDQTRAADRSRVLAERRGQEPEEVIREAEPRGREGVFQHGFLETGPRQDEGRIGMPPRPAPAVEEPEEELGLGGTRMERRAAGLPPIETRAPTEMQPLGEIGGPDPETQVFDPFERGFVERPDAGPAPQIPTAQEAVLERQRQEPGFFERTLGLEPARIPHVQEPMSLGESLNAAGEAALAEMGIKERDPEDIARTVVRAQPDVTREATGTGVTPPPPPLEDAARTPVTDHDRLRLAIEKSREELQTRFEKIPLPVRMTLSAGRAFLDAETGGRFDSHVNDLIDKATTAVRGVFGLEPTALTITDLFDTLDRTGWEKVGGAVGFLGAAGAMIRLTNVGVSATATMAARGTRTRAFLQSFNPNVPVTRGTRMLQAAVEGIPFDLAYQAENPQQRANNLVFGIVASALIGATPFAGKIKKPGDLDPRFRDPTTAQGGTRTGPEAFPIRRSTAGENRPLSEQTLAEALDSEGVRLDAEERAAAAEAADVTPPGAGSQLDPADAGLTRRPKVLTPENQAMHDAALAAPDRPALQRVMNNDPDWIAARRRPQPGDPNDTTNLHSDGDTRAEAGPVWDPQRVAEVHDPIDTRLTAEDNAGFWGGIEARKKAGAYFEGAVRRQRIIYMVTGPPAAGKSTISNPIVRAIRGLLIDSDEWKKGLPEHDGGRAAGTVHRESSLLAHNRMLKAALLRGDNIVMPMIGKSRRHVIDEAANLRKAGYEVHIVLNEIPPLEAARRAYLRFKNSDKYIPEAYILDEVGDAPTAMYHEAVESGLFTSHQRYSNDVPKGQDPRLIASGGEIPDGRLLFPGEPEAGAARQRRSGTGEGGLGRDRSPEHTQRDPGRSAGDGQAGRLAPARAAQGDLHNPEVEVKHTPPAEGPSRAPEVVPRRVTDPIPPKAPEGTQANGRGGFFNMGKELARGRLGAKAGALKVDVAAAGRRVGAFLQRNFTAPGDLPHRAWRLLLKSQGWFGAQITDMTFTLRRFDDALRDAYGTPNMNTSQKRRLNAALSGQIPLSRIPEPLRPIVRQMRERVDGFSQQMIQSGMVEGDLAAVIADNLGVYLSRSYKVFDTPSWQLENIPKPIVNRARSWLRKERPDLDENQLQGLIEGILDKQVDSPLQFLTGGTLGSKNLSMLIKRKDIHPAIRALMGEHTDVRLRYARSVSQMARDLSSHGFLTEVKNSLKATADNPNGLFHTVQTTNANGSFIVPIAAKGSKVMEPLSGLFTTREIADAFKREFDVPGQKNWLYSAYLKANAVVKLDKTVMSVMTHVRNLIGNAGFATANGHWRLQHFGRAIQAVNASTGISRGGRLTKRFLAGKVGIEVQARAGAQSTAQRLKNERRLRLRDGLLPGESPWESYYKRIQMLGVVDSSAHAGELAAVMRDASRKGLDNISPDEGLLSKGMRGFIKGATAIYRAEDDLWKIVAFENEFARYRKALPNATEAEVEETAAWIVRNTYPNYGMISSGVQALRKNILMGSFVSFPAEVFRTGWHTISLAIKEVRSPNPEIRKIGATRMAGLTVAAGGVYAASAASRFKNGVDAQQDKDLRPFLAPWQENSSLIYTSPPVDGVYSIIDLSYTDPYSYLRDPLRRLFSGEGDWEEALLEATLQAAAPFIGEEILFGKLGEINSNLKRSGGQVFNPEDHKVDQAFAILEHLWGAIEPGTFASARRIAKGINQETNNFGQEFDATTEFLAVVTGHRLQKTDVRQAMRFRTTEMDRRLNDANRILNRVSNRGGTVTDEELTEAFHRSERSRARVFADAHQLALKAINSHGLTSQEVIRQFRDGGMSRANAAAVVNTGIPPRRSPRIDDVNRAALIRQLTNQRR
jgi:predicted kinase